MKAKISGLVLSAFCLLAAIDHPSAAETRTLKISHQFPAAQSMEEGDFRDRAARKFAEEVTKRTDGAIEFEVYPAASLVKPPQQFNAMSTGALDMSVFPLAYATGQVPQVGVALLPGLVTSYKQGLAWRDAAIGKELEKALESRGVKLIGWLWQAGASVSNRPMVKPADVKGAKVRGPGREVNLMLQAAGGGIASLPSSETYSAMQSGVLDSVWTVSTSLISYRLHEFAKHATVTEDKALYFSFIPLLMSKATFDSLTPEQQQVVLDVGREIDEFATAEAIKDDNRLAEVYKNAGAELHVMDDATMAAWLELAKSSAWKDFEQNVKGGDRLLDLATQVK